MRLVVDSIEYCATEVPKWNTISISGYHIREAGSTAAQELAFTLADGMAYVDACLERGMHIDDFASRLSFFFDADRKSTRLNSSHGYISYAVFCLKKKMTL